MELFFGMAFLIIGYSLIKGIKQLAELVDSKYSQTEIDSNRYVGIVVQYICFSILFFIVVGCIFIYVFFAG